MRQELRYWTKLAARPVEVVETPKLAKAQMADDSQKMPRDVKAMIKQQQMLEGISR